MVKLKNTVFWLFENFETICFCQNKQKANGFSLGNNIQIDTSDTSLVIFTKIDTKHTLSLINKYIFFAKVCQIYIFSGTCIYVTHDPTLYSNVGQCQHYPTIVGEGHCPITKYGGYILWDRGGTIPRILLISHL